MSLFDPHFRQQIGVIEQTKTSQNKLVALVAGINRHVCYFTAFGDKLANEPMALAKPDMPEYLCKDADSKSIGRTIKAFMGERYSAAGLRHGAVNELTTTMPTELACKVTGHEFKNLCAIWRYMNANIPSLQPGATVLGGWPAQPWGHMRPGPKAARFDVLLDGRELTQTQLKVIVNETFDISSLSPREFYNGGSLIEVVVAAFAHLVMYFEVREENNEMPFVQRKLKENFAKFIHKQNVVVWSSDKVKESLRNWSRKVKADFDEMNLNLTQKEHAPMLEKLVHVVKSHGEVLQGLQKQVNSLQDQASSIETRNLGYLGDVNAQLTKIHEGYAGINSTLDAMRRRRPSPRAS